MGTKVGAVLERPAAKATCRHYWLIEPPDGPVSRGVCKLCGEVKMFDNVLEDLLSRRDSVAPFEPVSFAEEEEEAEDGDEI